MQSFENRFPPPLIVLLCAWGMWRVSPNAPHYHLGPLTDYLVMLLVLLGIICGVLGITSFRKAKTTVSPLTPEKSSSLVTDGIYKYTRNPMYLGFGMLLTSWAITLASMWCFIFLIIYFLYIQRFQITPEERALEALFGQEFLDYKSRVRKWV